MNTQKEITWKNKIERDQESKIQFLDTKGEKNFKNSTLTNEAEVNKTAEKSPRLADKSLAILSIILSFRVGGKSIESQGVVGSIGDRRKGRGNVTSGGKNLQGNVSWMASFRAFIF